MIVDSMEEALAAIPNLLRMDRRAVRKRFEDRFSATRMANDYLKLYRNLMDITRRQKPRKKCQFRDVRTT